MIQLKLEYQLYLGPHIINHMNQVNEQLGKELNAIKSEGLYKEERIIITPQSAEITTTQGKEVFKLLCQ